MLEQIGSIVEEELQRRKALTIRASGTSMWPLIGPNARVVLERCQPQGLKVGDIVCYRHRNGWVLHRVYGFHFRTGWLLLKGDWRGGLDRPVSPDQVIARVGGVLDSPWPAPLWWLANQLLIWGLAWPVSWLVGRHWGRECLHQMKRLSRPLMLLERVRRQLQVRLVSRTPDSGCISAGSGYLLDYQPGEPAQWALRLEQIKREQFGWGAGRLETPGPEHPGWDFEKDRAWIDFLLGQGFVVRERRPGLILEFVF